MATVPGSEKSKRAKICFQCRNRKVRCDGTVGGCENCKRLDFACSLGQDSSGTSQLPLDATLARRRAAKACVACRDKKSRCTGETPCERCRSYRIDCIYPPDRRRARRGPRPTTSSPSLSEHSAQDPKGFMIDTVEPIINKDPETSLAYRGVGQGSRVPPSSDFLNKKAIIREHVDAFFEHVYPIPGMGIIHRASLMRTWLDGSHNPRLLQALCGVASRFTALSRPAMAAEGQRWLEEAEAHLLHRSTEPLRTDIAALTLIAFDHCASRRFLRHVGALACVTKLAFIMRLNKEDSNAGFAPQEWRRRLMWALWTMDTLCSGQRNDSPCCPTNMMRVRLPCNERSFNFNIPVMVWRLEPGRFSMGSDAGGLATYLISIMDIWRRIRETLDSSDGDSDTVSNATTAGTDTFAGLVQTFERELDQHVASLPDNYTMNSRNLYSRLYLPSRTTFVMLHVWYHRTYCDLYHLVMDKMSIGVQTQSITGPGSSTLERYRHFCLQHATSMSALFSTLLQADDSVCITDPSLANCSLAAARGIFFSQYWTGSLLTNEERSQQVLHCASILEKPAGVYPTTRLVMGDILELHARLARNQPSEEQPFCTSYNVADEISRLQFPAEDPDLRQNPRTPKPSTPAARDEPVPTQNLRTDEGSNPSMTETSDTPSMPILEVPIADPITGGLFNHRETLMDVDQMEQEIWSMPGFEMFDVGLGWLDRGGMEVNYTHCHD